jgi:hypothetical protein
MIKDMTPREFVERRAGGADMTLLDVREDWETTLAPVPADIVHTYPWDSSRTGWASSTATAKPS